VFCIRLKTQNEVRLSHLCRPPRTYTTAHLYIQVHAPITHLYLYAPRILKKVNQWTGDITIYSYRRWWYQCGYIAARREVSVFVQIINSSYTRELCSAARYFPIDSVRVIIKHGDWVDAYRCAVSMVCDTQIHTHRPTQDCVPSTVYTVNSYPYRRRIHPSNVYTKLYIYGVLRRRKCYHC
jgi:hypothetical protein